MLNLNGRGRRLRHDFGWKSRWFRHSPGRRGIVPAEAGSAANECWMLDVELIGVFDRINRIYRIYRAGAKRRQPEAIFRIGSQAVCGPGFARPGRWLCGLTANGFACFPHRHPPGLLAQASLAVFHGCTSRCSCTIEGSVIHLFIFSIF
jgi:hypothetical protein